MSPPLPTVSMEEVVALLDEAPIPSKYHGQMGFEEGRFFTDYHAWMDKRRGLIAKIRETALKDALRVPHPSEFIKEEMVARGWRTADLVLAMRGGSSTELVPISGTELQAVKRYLYSEAAQPPLFDNLDVDALARAFGVAPEFLRNLEEAWLASRKGA